MQTTRRKFMAGLGLGLGAAAFLPSLRASEGVKTPVLPVYKPGEYKKINATDREFHLSVTTGELMSEGLVEHNHPMGSDPRAVKLDAQTMIELWKEAGVTDIWLDPYNSGVFRDVEEFDKAVRRSLEFGMKTHFITVPFGHPGLDPAPDVKARWKKSERFTGRVDYGIACHEPTAQDCVASIRKIADHYGQCDVFLDDDYRWGLAPGDIGGCVCAECKADFMQKTGLSDARWNALLDDLRATRDTKDVRLYVDYFCDILTRTFKESEAIAPEVDLGVMVMGMGSENSAVRLDDYRGKLFRVGEWMFTDAQYESTKNKTIELYSVLFHRRFTDPGRTFSETTIIQELSAENYVSKLSTSTLADARNTMFMCPIPASYWSLIAPRMKREREFHRKIIGCKARGPFKHFWGLADRYIGGYNAYSLFLACGVPFEVCDEIPADGYAFLGDASAREMERGELESKGAKCVARLDSASGRFDKIPETFEDLFEFRRALLEKFRADGVPYVEEETPVVLGWYPDARAAYLWNVDKTDKVVTLRKGDWKIAVELKSLDSALIELP